MTLASAFANSGLLSQGVPLRGHAGRKLINSQMENWPFQSPSGRQAALPGRGAGEKRRSLGWALSSCSLSFRSLGELQEPERPCSHLSPMQISTCPHILTSFHFQCKTKNKRLWDFFLMGFVSSLKVWSVLLARGKEESSCRATRKRHTHKPKQTTNLWCFCFWFFFVFGYYSLSIWISFQAGSSRSLYLNSVNSLCTK